MLVSSAEQTTEVSSIFARQYVAIGFVLISLIPYS